MAAPYTWMMAAHGPVLIVFVVGWESILGVAFGVLVVHAGVDRWWATLSSALIYGGSFEFLLIGMVAAAAPLASVAVSAFLVNVRHVFYALSFPLRRVDGPLGKAYGTFALCDEAYALTAGALLGSLIPDGVTGLDFALTALFTVLALDAVRDRRGDLPTPLFALPSALTARLLFPGSLLRRVIACATCRSPTPPCRPRRRPWPSRSVCTCGAATPRWASWSAPPSMPRRPVRSSQAERTGPGAAPVRAAPGPARRDQAARRSASCLALVAASWRARSREASYSGTSSDIAGFCGAMVSSGTMKSTSRPRPSARTALR